MRGINDRGRLGSAGRLASRLSPAVAPRFVSCSAYLHAAPATTPILGRVEEHPPAVLTCLEPLPRAVVLRCEQRSDDLAEHIVCAMRIGCQHDAAVYHRCCQGESAEDWLQRFKRMVGDGSRQRVAPLAELVELPGADRPDREALSCQPVVQLILRSPCISAMFAIDAVAEPADDFQGTSRSAMIRPAPIR